MMHPVEQLPNAKREATKEPEMIVCDRCCYPCEADVIVKQLIPGGDETRNVCPDCR